MVVLFIIISFFLGCAVSSYFGKRKGEKYYIFRTYRLYNEGKVDLMTVIIAGAVNTMLGAIILGLIVLKKIIS